MDASKSHPTVSPFFTVQELADYIKLSPATVRAMVKDGRLRKFKIGARLRFDKAYITRWLATIEEQSAGVAEADEVRNGDGE